MTRSSRLLLGAGSTIHVESPLLREELLAPSPKPADSTKVGARAAARGSQRSRIRDSNYQS